MRAERALQQPADPKEPKKGSVREGLEALERAGMPRDPLLDSVRVPRGWEWLWCLFWEIRQGATQGFAGAFLTWVDLDAYGRVTGAPLRGFEAEAIMQMDCALRGEGD